MCVYIYLCTDMCVDMPVDMYTDMCVGICVHMLLSHAVCGSDSVHVCT